MGQLHKVNLRGRTNRIVEGELLLGRDSHGIAEEREHRDKRRRLPIDNPWQFCTESQNFDEIERLVGNYVVIEYKTPRKSTLLKCKAPFELVRIYAVDRSHSPEGAYKSRTLSLNTTSTGVNVGRIINAVESGKHTLTWEVILQEGNSGNLFTAMNVADDGLFDFAVKSLKHANKVKIYYVERFFNGVRLGNNGIYIWKIENLDDI